MSEKTSQAMLPVELIERRIYLIRGHKVMLDATWQRCTKWKPAS